MTITFYGAAGEVTGAKHLLVSGRNRILLDCGAFQGRRADSRLKNSHFDFDPREITAVILSHAHFDHVGLLPLLVKRGFNGPIYSTNATRDLAELILLDAAKLQVQEAEYVNRHRLPDAELSQPLYTPDDVPSVMELFKHLPYFHDQPNWLDIGPGVKAKFYDAGHILGSAVTVLGVSEDGRQKYIGYSGDLGRYRQPILRDPEEIKEPLDLFIMEATYGDRLSHPHEQVESKLLALFSQAIATGGRIIVPAFSLGRTQQLVYILHALTDAGRLPRLPIYIDSPLSNRITGVYRRHQEDYDRESEREFSRPHEDPLVFSNLHYLQSVDESKHLNSLPGPWMVIAASGMIVGGRIIHHLQRYLGDPKTIVLLTGYQAEHTPGRRLLKGAKTLRLFGSDVPVRARIEKINDLSAHADAATLRSYVQSIPRVENLALVHAEPDRAAAAAELLRSSIRGKIVIPQPKQVIEI